MAGAETKRELRRVTVATVRTVADAQRIKAVLDEEKIESFVANERAVATSRSGKRALAAIVIQVSRSQVTRAVEVLRAHSERTHIETVATNLAAAPVRRTVITERAARTIVPMAAVLALVLGFAWLLFY